MVAGQVAQARALLETWKKSNRTDARATYLTARLSQRAEDAEDAYLTVALSHATSDYAPESLLRLGQARMAAGDPKQASVYFQRLLADYPRSVHRTAAQDWLSRIRSTAQNAAAPSSTLPRPSAATPILPSTDAQRTRVAIQIAAFRERSGARSVARQVEKAGFADVRLVTMPENSLIRVRIGKFESASQALPIATKLKAAGFSAVIVSDAEREQQLRE